MNKARDLSLTIAFLLASVVAYSATHNETTNTAEDSEPKAKYKATSVLGFNIFDLFMLAPVKQDTTIRRHEDEAVMPKKEA